MCSPAGAQYTFYKAAVNKSPMETDNDDKEKRAADLIITNKELAFQNDEKEKRAAELIVANKELAFQNDEKEKRAQELIVANKELAFQNDEKEKRAAELIVANKELAFQNDEKEKRAAELIVANKELAFQNDEKEKRAQELIVANMELAFQNDEKEKRAAELIVANKELVFQIGEKEKRAAELVIADIELDYQSKEKEKRAAELVIADIELDFQNKEKEKREIVNKELEALSYSAKLASQYSLSLIEASRDPLFTISLEGKITDMNEATVRVTGIPRKKIIGTDFFNYFTEPDKARQGYEQVFAKGFVADYPLTIVDDKLTDVLFNGSVYKDGIGNVLGAVVVARDITEQKRIEKELIEAKVFAELATGIAEEAKAKAETATAIAESAVKAKQQFLSNMSHEIRTPMNAIIGFTKVVLKTELQEKQKEYLNAIKVSGDALIVLINDILDLAKVDSGKMTFEQTPFKLGLSISAMLHLFEAKVQEKNLQLVKLYDKNIPEVLVGDPARLHQIIMNLVSNAVKFTSKGKVTVSISLEKEEADIAYVKFEVTDTGIGIPDDKIESIFENFQQASSSTTRVFGGTGLGLAIVKQLVMLQGGSVTVTSVEGEGSAFSFILAFHKTDAQAENETGQVEQQAKIKNVKILVVEDIPLNQLLMQTILDDLECECDIANNGHIAIEKLRTNAYDIILMDLQMPVMNGFETTAYIRNEMKSTIPIVALTADVTTVDLAKCKAVGMDDYLAKPVDEILLYNKIELYAKNNKHSVRVKPEVNWGEKKHQYIDLTYLTKCFQSKPARIPQMIALYLDQTPQLITDINQSLKDKDWDTMYEAAHKVMPSFALMGISKEYERMSLRIQALALAQLDTKELQNLIFRLSEVCAQACVELKTEYDKIIIANN